MPSVLGQLDTIGRLVPRDGAVEIHGPLPVGDLGVSADDLVERADGGLVAAHIRKRLKIGDARRDEDLPSLTRFQHLRSPRDLAGGRVPDDLALGDRQRRADVVDVLRGRGLREHPSI